MRNDNLKKRYEELLQGEYDGKRLWEHICENKLTGTPSFKGARYEKSDTRLMIVGRAMNGWEYDFVGCNSAESVAEAILSQEFDFTEIISREGAPYTEDKNKRNYLFSKSNFFRLVKYVLEQYGESDNTGDKDRDWYEDAQEWQQRFVWSNLYKISPRKSNNPEWKMIKPQMQNYIGILKEELEIHRPKRVLFITGMGYLHPWEKLPSFFKQFNFSDKQMNNKDSYIEGIADYNGIAMVLCKRPDKWGTSHEDIRKMSKEIVEAFDILEKEKEKSEES